MSDLIVFIRVLIYKHTYYKHVVEAFTLLLIVMLTFEIILTGW